MRRSSSRYLLPLLCGLILGGFVFFYGPTLVHAQADLGLNFAAEIGLGDTDPRIIAARVIRAILGFLGILALGLILYSGFMWMTSGGNDEKVDKAKKLLRNAVIGLAIVLASFGIAQFILNNLLEITGGGGSGGVCSPSCLPGQYCCSGVCQNTACSTFGGTNPFRVRNTIPTNGSSNLPRNTVIRYRFTEGIRASSVDDRSFTVFEEPAHTPVNGTRTVNGSYIEFVPDTLCPAPHDTLHCFSANMQIAVTAVDGDIFSNSGKRLDCRGGGTCIIDFTTGNYVDTERPRVNITSQQVCVAINNTMEASATDDYGISKIDFYVEGGLVGSELNTPPPLTPFNAMMVWDGTSFTVGQTVTLKATTTDFDSNEASSEKRVKVSPGHCCSGVQDGDETGIDCGGSCLACNGGACAPDRNQPGVCSDEMCSSDFCTANGSSATSCEDAGFPAGTTNCCLCQAKPKINAVSPLGGFCSHDSNISCRLETEEDNCGSGNTCNMATPNGQAGNFITISGSGFGTTRGQVFFSGPGGRREVAKFADDPIVGNALCGTNVWSNNQIIIVVPAGAVDGPLFVESVSGGQDGTNDAYGSLINDFKKNTIERPGLCIITPTAGRLSDTIDYKGIKMTAGEAYFGSLSEYVQALSSSFTRDKEGSAEVPNLVTGGTTTYLSKGNVYSNFLNFTKNNEPTTGPVISSIEPAAGPVGQYITIRGSGFGNDRGTSSVRFDNATGPEADYKFPDVCAESIWTDRQIVIKVPAGISLGSYSLFINRDGSPSADSGNQKFEVTSGTPDPGICRLDPVLGQTNSSVMLWGEYFRNKDTNSIVRFYNNRVQTGGALTFWDIDTSASGIKPWKVITTVPTSAISGPVRIEVGSPVQTSNSLNFAVGTCNQDSDCGSTATCCAAGLPEAGRCKADASECYGAVATSVFEWQFSTGYESASCQPDQTQCGSLCCASGCDPTDPGKCASCAAGQNQCGDGSCCSGACAPGIGGGPSFCPDSCSGYVYQQCIEGYFCPNSPGTCSPSGGSGQVVTGECNNAVCNSLAGCSGGSCQYNSGVNRCVTTTSLTANCSAKDLKDGNGNPIMDGSRVVEGRCEVFRGDPVWTINWSASCPTGWSKGVGNTCIDPTSINGSCSVCESTASCTMNGSRGVCTVGNTVCGSGSTCDPTDQKCKKPDTGTCACCCDKNNPERDCCAGLSCDGSCGTGPNLGFCSGCVVGGVAQDDLCNCAGHDGKICDASVDPRGRCVDCSAITDPAECSSHARCCVDGRNGENKCTSLTAGQPVVPENVGGTTLNFCGYFKCTGLNPNSCNPLAVKNGVYKTVNACDTACIDAPIPCGTRNDCSIGPSCPTGMTCDLNSGGSSCVCKPDGGGGGDLCTDPDNSFACLMTGGCTAGYTCLDKPGDTCRCCCKPPVGGAPDTCKDIDPSLSCLADQGACSGGDRGLCCGCTKDSICGDVATTGCSTVGSRCCSSRPGVETHLPAIDSTDVCRNAVIEATFDQKMDLTSFSESDNVQIIGDYGTDPCPSGYPIVASAPPATGLAAVVQFLKKVVITVAPFLSSQQAFADMSNFCVVSGSAIGAEVSGTKSKVTFRIQRPLEASRKYYVVLKGDPALADLGSGTAKDYYNAHITNRLDIGMVGLSRGRYPAVFNHTEFKNAEIWAFTTGRDICALDSVKVSPDFHLFQKTGQELFLNAYARSRNGQSIQGIAGVYDWGWDWKSDNASLVRVEQQSDPVVALATAGNAKDAQTLGKATATISVDTINSVSTRGKSTAGVSQLRLFLCENPWPVYFATPGYPWPWRDDVTGVEFYYCRDQAGVGTSDDLPALQEEPLVGPSSRRICMFGDRTNQSCRSDSDCGARGSCLPEVLKEFFFFREAKADIPVLEGRVEPIGKSVTLQWDTTNLATKYKVYYGLSPRNYTSSIEVPITRLGTITKTISGLVNGRVYYFAVTALTDKNQESSFSNEITLKPVDTTPPASPAILGSAGDKQAGLFWSPVSEAVNYMAYLGVQSRGSDLAYVYPVSKIVRNNPIGNNPNVVFTNLDNAGTYYLAVKAIDLYGNLSPYSNEVIVRPNTPYLVSADNRAREQVTLTWLPFIGAQGYTITYTSRVLREPVTVNVSGSTLSRSINDLQADEAYTFSITARKADNTNSNSSNALTVTVR